LFDRFGRDARNAGINQDTIMAAEFALAAFVDETIFGSEWSSKDAWLAQPLQMELFNVFNAGEAFFDRVKELQQRTQANAEMLEIYYLCLALGFRGKYQLIERGPEMLKQIVEDLYNDLRRAAGKPIEALAPHGKPRGEMIKVVKEKVPAWVVGAAAAAVGLVFYLVMTVRISGKADAIKHAIDQIM
jgi:type VI secretion system protein ImpK